MPAVPVIVDCPSCGKPVEWTPATAWRPFCSRRCKLLDLGEWLTEGHRIPDEEAGDELSDGDRRSGD